MIAHNPPRVYSPTLKKMRRHFRNPSAIVNRIVPLLQECGPLPRDEIVRRLWGADYLNAPYANTFWSTMCTARKKARADGLTIRRADGLYSVEVLP